jgi:hypothetical protein
MGTMRGSERIIDVHVGQRGQGIGEGVIVLRLTRVEAQVLQQEHLPWLQGGSAGRGVGTDHVIRTRDGQSQDVAEPIRDGSHGVCGIDGTVGSSEVGGQHHPGTPHSGAGGGWGRRR